MGRYYNKQGIFQEGAGMREARKLDLVPSVTTILEIINKEYLNKWKIDRHLSIAAYNHDIDMYTGDFESYKIAIKNEFKSNTTAVDFGNKIHNDLENIVNFYKNNEYSILMLPKIDSVGRESLILGHDLVKEIFVGIVALKANGFNTEIQITGSGYSGTIDLMIETKERVFIFDYKTQNKELEKMCKYKEWIMQLAAYAKAVQRNIKKPVSVYNIIINRNYEYKFVKYSYKELCHGWRMFKSAFQLWQEYNKFYVTERGKNGNRKYKDKQQN
jgi:hypothetical protein